MSDCSGRNVLITGGGRGIGAACAVRFAQGGANVSVISRTRQQVDRVVSKLQIDFPHQKFFGFSGDVSHEADVVSWVQQSTERLGTPTDLINNAADFFSAPLVETTLQEWRRLFSVNVDGVFLCSREFAKVLISRKASGGIVNIGSLAGIRGLTKFSAMSAYCATKSALVTMTEALAVELKPHGIRVNLIAPGAIETEMLQRAAPGLHSSASPQDLADVVVSMSNPKAFGIVSGSILEVLTNH